MTEMPRTTSDATVLRKERAEAMKQLLLIGGRMSNVMFNLRQKKVSDFVDKADGELFITSAAELQEAWDKAKNRLNATKDTK